MSFADIRLICLCLVTIFVSKFPLFIFLTVAGKGNQITSTQITQIDTQTNVSGNQNVSSGDMNTSGGDMTVNKTYHYHLNGWQNGLCMLTAGEDIIAASKNSCRNYRFDKSKLITKPSVIDMEAI